MEPQAKKGGVRLIPSSAVHGASGAGTVSGEHAGAKVMNAFLGEVIGTAILILLGNGVVANVVLTGTKGHGSGWIVITWGWGMAVFVAVFTVAAFSGAHINPAVTIALAIVGKFEWSGVPAYIAAQFLGAFIGAFLVWLFYRPHFGLTEDKDLKLACFCTGAGGQRSALQSRFGNHRHLPARIRSPVPCGFGLRPGCPGRAAGRPPGAGDRLEPGGHDRLRHQSGARPGATHHACDPADAGRQARQRLGLRLDPRGRAADRRGARRASSIWR